MHCVKSWVSSATSYKQLCWSISVGQNWAMSGTHEIMSNTREIMSSNREITLKGVPPKKVAFLGWHSWALVRLCWRGSPPNRWWECSFRGGPLFNPFKFFWGDPLQHNLTSATHNLTSATHSLTSATHNLTSGVDSALVVGAHIHTYNCLKLSVNISEPPSYSYSTHLLWESTQNKQGMCFEFFRYCKL